MSREPSITDRLAIRARPQGLALMRQTWGKLLFMHWALDPSVLRPLIPAPLSIDTFENQAWIGVVPFTMWGIRASFLPPIPGTSAFHELNVRTYVHLNEIPGVWFFSLDAAHRLAAWGARKFYYLPYFNAEMHLEQQGDEIEYSSKRTDAETYSGFFEKEREVFPDLNISESQNLPRASLSMKWNIGETFPVSTPGSIGFFLTERYCLYSVHHNLIYRSRIFHEPWSLRRAKVCSCASTMIQSLGIPQPAGEPLLHYAEAIDVNVWPLQPA